MSCPQGSRRLLHTRVLVADGCITRLASKHHRGAILVWGQAPVALVFVEPAGKASLGCDAGTCVTHMFPWATGPAAPALAGSPPGPARPEELLCAVHSGLACQQVWVGGEGGACRQAATRGPMRRGNAQAQLLVWSALVPGAQQMAHCQRIHLTPVPLGLVRCVGTTHNALQPQHTAGSGTASACQSCEVFAGLHSGAHSK